MPTAVVTGGAGFLGSHLCDYLLERGHRVICIDNLVSGSLTNIEHLRDNVFRFAALASPEDYLRMPLHSLKVGSYGTHHALGLAKFKRARFLLASTSEVYGDPQVHPQPETYWGHVNPIGPRGVYDEAKRFAEAMTMAYHRYHGIETRIARIFNTYGPRMRPHDGRGVSNFLIQALQGRPVNIYGDGRQTRSFCFVADLVDGLFRLLMSLEVEPVNLGNPTERSIRDLVAAVEGILGRPLQVTYNPLPQDDPRVRQPDITRARECLGWEPKVDLEAGLRETIGHFQEKGTPA